MRDELPSVEVTPELVRQIESAFDGDDPDLDRRAKHLALMLLLMAVKDRASSIHIEPEPDEVRLSYVVDGRTYSLVPPPKAAVPSLVAAIRSIATPSRPRRRAAERLRRWALALDRRPTVAWGVDFRIQIEGLSTSVHAWVRPTEQGDEVCLIFAPPPDAALSDAASRVASQDTGPRGKAAEAAPPPSNPVTPMIRPTLTPPPPETLRGAAYDLWQRRRTCLDLLESCLARIDEWEPNVHAWVIVDRDGARAQARALDEELAAGRSRGPLHGIPIGVKDIVDVAGLPSACGSPLGADGAASADAPIVARLRAAGAVVVGKTVTTPYAWVDPPPTRNPWNLDRTPGGSSSGSAAAVALGMVLGAIGSQTGGSITRPAAYCGVCGLKPTYGRLPLEGILPLAPSLDHPGPIARTVADLDRFWNVLAGPDPRDVAARAVGAPIRLGLPRGFFADRVEPAMRAAMAQAVEVLRRAADVEVVEVDLPDAFADVTRHHRLVMAAEAASVHAARLAARPDAYPERIRALVEEGRAITATDYVHARRHQDELKQAMRSSFEGVDAQVTPAAPGPAPDPSTTGDPVMNSPWSTTGLPTVSMPIGLSPEGLPLALQLVAPPFHEAELLRIGARCEELLAPHREGSP